MSASALRVLLGHRRLGALEQDAVGPDILGDRHVVLEHVQGLLEDQDLVDLEKAAGAGFSDQKHMKYT